MSEVKARIHRPNVVPLPSEILAGKNHHLAPSFRRGIVELRYYLPVVLAHAVRGHRGLVPGHVGWYWMRDDERQIPAIKCDCGQPFFGGAYPMRPLTGKNSALVNRALIVRASIVLVEGEVASIDAVRLACCTVSKAAWWVSAARAGIHSALENFT